MHRSRLAHFSPSFFVLLSLVGIGAVLVGFAKTFIYPLFAGTKTWPYSIYLHAMFVFGWIILFLVQSILVQRRNLKLHRQLGKVGFFIALGAAVSIIPAALFQCERELKQGLGQTAVSSILGAVLSSAIFFTLVALAIGYKRKPAIHKRLMLLATIVLLWPAWFRWRHYFPSVPRPDIWFGIVLADSLILLAFVWDWKRNTSIHPVLLFTGLAIIVEQTLEIILFDSPGWRIVANLIYETFQ